MNDYSGLIQGKGISFHGDVPEYPLWIEGDQTRLTLDRHDGEITASSRCLNQGSQFVVKIPLVQAESVPAQAPGQLSAADRKYRQVLIIEDQPDIVAVLQLFIQDILGLDAITASDASAGLKLARMKRPDVIICDIGLPGEMNGYDVAKAVRGAPEISSIKLIALTGYGTEGDKRKSLEAGFDQHMTKPPNLDWLQDILTSGT